MTIEELKKKWKFHKEKAEYFASQKKIFGDLFGDMDEKISFHTDKMREVHEHAAQLRNSSL